MLSIITGTEETKGKSYSPTNIRTLMVMHQHRKKYQKIILKSVIFSSILPTAQDEPVIQFIFLFHYNNYDKYNSHFLSSEPLLADLRLSFTLTSINQWIVYIYQFCCPQFERQRSCFQQKTGYQLAMESNPWEQIESAVLPSAGLNPAYPLTSQVK